MTYEQANQYIQSLEHLGMEMNLNNITAAMDKRNNPQNQLKYVHVAGTNGKGSTARMIQSILTQAGYKTGLFSSPAPLALCETITIDGQPISTQDFAKLTEQLSGDRLTEFELVTAMAILYFLQNKVDIAVMECGLGGLNDATNVIPPPVAAVLARISKDHLTILGNSISEIALQKCGIFKSTSAVVTTPAQHPQALEVIMEQAASKGLVVHIPNIANSKLLSQKLGSTSFEYDGQIFDIPLTGEFQRENALTAIECAKVLNQRGFDISQQSIKKGIEKATLPYRLEVISTQPLVIIDGAHNPHGTKALARTLKYHHVTGLTLITGMLKDKEAVKSMAHIAPFCREAICCTPAHPRAMNAVEMAKKVRVAAPGLRVTVASTPEEAYTRWRSSAPMLATGSFFVAGRIRQCITEKREKAYSW